MSKPQIEICLGSSCFARGNNANIELVEKYLADHGLVDDVDLVLSASLCKGKCPAGPIVVVDGQTYTAVDRGVMLDILNKLFGDRHE